MNKYLSEKIKFVYAVLSLMIVLLHSTYSYIPEYLDGKWIQFQFEIMRFLTIITTVAVPTFFVISAYLYYLTYYSINDYLLKIKKRTISTVIPYLLWGIGSYIYYFILVNFTNLFDSKTVPTTGVEVFKYIFLCEGNPPLWYLRTLLVFFLVSPIIYWVMKFFGTKSLFIIVIVYICNVIFEPLYTSVFFWLPHILIGTWLALYGQEYVKSAKEYSLKSRLMIVLLSVGYSIFLFFLNDEHHFLFYTWRIVSVVFFWILISGFKKHKLEWISNLSFFIYCTHFIIIEAVRGVLIKTISVQNWSVILIFLLTFCITLLCILFVASVLKRYMSFFWNIINGGR